MTALRLQIGLFSFAVLASAALVNIFYLQPVPAANRNARIETGAGEVQVALSPEASRAQATVDAGLVNDALRVIQRELQARGYATGPDGGGITMVLQAAIMAYEFDQGLALTGDPSENLKRTIILGPASIDATAQATATPGPVARQVIVATQQMMIKLGYGPLTADGAVSDGLAAAIRRFEREQSMTATGRISGDLVAKLTKLSTPGRMSNQR